jgi:hypothetical protein
MTSAFAVSNGSSGRRGSQGPRTGPHLPNQDIFAPGQHAQLRVSRAPLPQMEDYPYYAEELTNPNVAYVQGAP